MSKSWSEDLTTGIQTIDAQHKELFARTDRLLDRCLEGEDLKVYAETFDYLRAYVDFHFRAEQGLMDANRYPQADFHKGQHRWLADELDKLHAEHQEKGLNASSERRFAYLLVEWFRNHILGVDRKLTDFLKAKSVGPSAPGQTAG